MKKKILILMAAVVAATAPLAPQASAASLSISVGDRPYYHGANYWHEGYSWVWVPGHRNRHGRWIRAHYERRGGWHREHASVHFRHHHYWRWW